MRAHKKVDPAEAIAAVLGGMFLVGVLGASWLPESIGRHFGWLFLPPAILLVGACAWAILTTLFRSLR